MSRIMAEGDMQCFVDTSNSEESEPDNEEAEMDLLSLWISPTERENIVQPKTTCRTGESVYPEQVWDRLKQNWEAVSHKITYVKDKWQGWAAVSMKEMPFSQRRKPKAVICDVYFINPKDPMTILTFTNGEKDDAVAYNSLLKVPIQNKIEENIQETIHLVHGVITQSACTSLDEFKHELQGIADTAVFKFPRSSLVMGDHRYRILTRIMLDMFSAEATIPTVESKNEISTEDELEQQVKQLKQQALDDKLSSSEKLKAVEVQLQLTSDKLNEVETQLATERDMYSSLKRDFDEGQIQIDLPRSLHELDRAKLREQIAALSNEQTKEYERIGTAKTIGINRQLEKQVKELGQQASDDKKLEAFEAQLKKSSSGSGSPEIKDFLSSSVKRRIENQYKLGKGSWKNIIEETSNQYLEFQRTKAKNDHDQEIIKEALKQMEDGDETVQVIIERKHNLKPGRLPRILSSIIEDPETMSTTVDASDTKYSQKSLLKRKIMEDATEEYFKLQRRFAETQESNKKLKGLLQKAYEQMHMGDETVQKQVETKFGITAGYLLRILDTTLEELEKRLEIPGPSETTSTVQRMIEEQYGLKKGSLKDIVMVVCHSPPKRSRSSDKKTRDKRTGDKKSSDKRNGDKKSSDRRCVIQ